MQISVDFKRWAIKEMNYLAILVENPTLLNIVLDETMKHIDKIVEFLGCLAELEALDNAEAKFPGCSSIDAYISGLSYRFGNDCVAEYSDGRGTSVRIFKKPQAKRGGMTLMGHQIQSYPGYERMSALMRDDKTGLIKIEPVMGRAKDGTDADAKYSEFIRAFGECQKG